MMSGAQFTGMVTIAFCPVAALVSGIVVALLTWSLGVGVVAAVAGLAVGWFVGMQIANFWLHRWPGETDDVPLEAYERAQRRYAAHEVPWTEEEMDARDKVQWAMVELEVRAMDEQRDLTASEKRERKRLEAKQNEMYRAHDGTTWWRDATDAIVGYVLPFGGPITTLAVAFVVGWLLGG